MPRFSQNGLSSIEEAREWVRKFVHWYNYIHLHSGLKFITPYQRHSGLDEQIMNKRIETYEKARSLHPERWSKNIRDWKLPSYVSLTPIKEDEYKKLTQLGVLKNSYI